MIYVGLGVALFLALLVWWLVHPAIMLAEALMQTHEEE